MNKVVDGIDIHIGNRLRMRRMLLGMSQEMLGEALGLTFQQIQKYEKGLNRIGAGRLYRIAQVLGVGIEYFYDGLPVDGEIAGAAEADRRDAEITAFLSTPEGYSLSSAFSRIADGATRRRLVQLVRTLAEAENA